MRRAALLGACLSLLTFTPAIATEYSVAIFPAHGDRASAQDWEQAYQLATATPGLTAYFFAATWGEFVDDDHNRLEEFKSTVRHAQVSKLPGYLGIQVINTAQRGVPKEFKRTRWTKPELLIKFDDTLKQLASVTAADIKWLSIGNEADVYLADNEDELEDFLKFYEQAAKTARRYFPNAKIGITVTFDGFSGKRRKIVEQLVNVSDGVFITYYPVTPKLTLKTDTEAEQDIASMLTAYPSKPIYIQELGFPSSPVVGSSDAAQATYFKKMIATLNATPNISYVNLFLLHDFSPGVCKALQRAYKMIGSDFAALLCSLGLFDTNGKAKESWQVILDALKPVVSVPPPETEPEKSR